jgi:P4 family phage/plasmid primase-like protien
MIGSQNISNISLKELSQRFASYGLLGKLLNSCADLEVSALEDTSVIKKILGEDSLRGEPKGKDAISFRNYAKLVFSTNELPLVIYEKTNGFYRRLMILNMTRQPDNKRADYLELLKRETDYLIRLSVKALERMYETGHIKESAGSREAVQSLRNDSDTVEAWIFETCYRVRGARVERGQLYQSYDSYCFSTDRTSLSRNGFYRAMRMKDFKEVKSNGLRYFEGISFDAPAVKKCPETDLEENQIEFPF